MSVPEITVVCFKWIGWRDNTYRAWHVNALRHMVAENLKIPHRFVCVTDNPAGIKCETRPLWHEPQVPTQKGKANCYRRLRLFSAEARSMFGGYILSIDLDTVIMDDITPLITGDDFKMVRGKASPLNGSMWAHRTGTREDLWNQFKPLSTPDQVRRHARITGIKHTGSDQAWISYKHPDTPSWGPEDGVYHFSLLRDHPLPANARAVFFAGSQKPWSEKCRTEQPLLYAKYREALLATDFQTD